MEGARAKLGRQYRWTKRALVTGGSAGGAIAIALLMAIAPTVGAITPITKTAPYSGTSASPFAYTAQSCGSAGGVAAKWVASTGVITGSSSASFAGCPPWLGYQYGDSSHGTNVVIPFKIGTPEEYNVTVNFKWSVLGSVSLTTTGCPAATNYTSGYNYVYCDSYLSWGAQLQTTIWDTTNGSQQSATYNYWAVGNYSDTYTTNYCSYGTCGSSSYTYTCLVGFSYQTLYYDDSNICAANGVTSTGSASIWSNTTTWSGTYGTNNTLAKGHTYVIEISTVFFGYASAYSNSYGYTGSTYFYHGFKFPGSGKASVNGATLGNGITVSSVVIADGS